MLDCFNNKMTIPFIMILFILCIYFYIEWRTKKIVDHKIKKLIQKNKIEEPEIIMDDQQELNIDIYIDPSQIYDK
jgi:hypothetical protein